MNNTSLRKTAEDFSRVKGTLSRISRAEGTNLFRVTVYEQYGEPTTGSSFVDTRVITFKAGENLNDLLCLTPDKAIIIANKALRSLECNTHGLQEIRDVHIMKENEITLGRASFCRASGKRHILFSMSKNDLISAHLIDGKTYFFDKDERKIDMDTSLYEDKTLEKTIGKIEKILFYLIKKSWECGHTSTNVVQLEGKPCNKIGLHLDDTKKAPPPFYERPKFLHNLHITHELLECGVKSRN